MSFIYAEKYSVDESRRKSIRVLCDTKVTPNNYSAANFSNVSYDLIMNHGYGIIDTLPPPVEAGDSCSWFSDRCHGFTHGLTQSPRA